jgi:predicted metalloprotease with PDZ domain
VNLDYYTGGQIMGHLLDFAIRNATNNQKSLDDWMRLLYQRYALPKPGFEPEDAVRAASEVAGKDMSDFFRRYLSGKEVPPYEEYFALAGIEVEKRVDAQRPFFGASYQRGEDGHARITGIAAGGPAEAAGLDRGDIVLAVDGHTVTAEEFQAVIGAHHPGEAASIDVVHTGQPKTIAVTLAADPYPTYVFRLMENPSELQKKVYESWLGLRP